MPNDKKRPANYNPEKRKANAEMARHLKERPAVTDANKLAYRDSGKKHESEFGRGAKLAPQGSALRAQQDAAAKAKTDAYYKKHGYYNVEDKNRPVTKGGVIARDQPYNAPMKNSSIDKLTKKKQ